MDPMQRSSNKPYFDACLAVASGDTARIHRARDDMVDAATRGKGDWVHVVLIDAVLDDADAAVRHMELAIGHNEGGVQNCAALPSLAKLRRDKRFAAQIRRLNLPV